VNSPATYLFSRRTDYLLVAALSVLSASVFAGVLLAVSSAVFFAFAAISSGVSGLVFAELFEEEGPEEVFDGLFMIDILIVIG
jgi:hypothetical protein